MQTLIVKNIEEKQTKDGTKTFFIITDTTGASFSLWEPIGMIKPGCVLEADIEVKGKYANIKDFKITKQPDNPIPAQTYSGKPTYGQDSPEKRRSIERQTALVQSIEFLRSTPNIQHNSTSDVLRTALTFYLWISEGKIPPPPPSSTSEAQATGASKSQSSDTQPESSKPIEKPPTLKRVKRVKEEFKDQTSFQKIIAKDFPALNSPRAICKELNISSMPEITDYWDAYLKIAGAR